MTINKWNTFVFTISAIGIFINASEAQDFKASITKEELQTRRAVDMGNDLFAIIVPTHGNKNFYLQRGEAFYRDNQFPGGKLVLKKRSEIKEHLREEFRKSVGVYQYNKTQSRYENVAHFEVLANNLDFTIGEEEDRFGDLRKEFKISYDSQLVRKDRGTWCAQSTSHLFKEKLSVEMLILECVEYAQPLIFNFRAALHPPTTSEVNLNLPVQVFQRKFILQSITPNSISVSNFDGSYQGSYSFPGISAFRPFFIDDNSTLIVGSTRGGVKLLEPSYKVRGRGTEQELSFTNFVVKKQLEGTEMEETVNTGYMAKVFVVNEKTFAISRFSKILFYDSATGNLKTKYDTFSDVFPVYSGSDVFPDYAGTHQSAEFSKNSEGQVVVTHKQKSTQVSPYRKYTNGDSMLYSLIEEDTYTFSEEGVFISNTHQESLEFPSPEAFSVIESDLNKPEFLNVPGSVPMPATKPLPENQRSKHQETLKCGKTSQEDCG